VGSSLHAWFRDVILNVRIWYLARSGEYHAKKAFQELRDLERRDRADYGDIYDQVLAIVRRHDNNDAPDKSSVYYAYQIDSMLRLLPTAMTLEDFRRVMSSYLDRHSITLNRNLHASFDEVTEDVWNAWNNHRAIQTPSRG